MLAKLSKPIRRPCSARWLQCNLLDRQVYAETGRIIGAEQRG